MRPAESPVFLVGAQRSGTTALGLAVAEAYAAGGGSFTVNGRLPSLLHRWLLDADISNRHFRADEICHALDRRPTIGPAGEGWARRCHRILPEAARQLAEHGYDGDRIGLAREIIAASYDTPMWGDKYNEYLLELPWLTQLFPAARWIFLYRHPAAVVDSMMRWRIEKVWNPRNRAACEQKWLRWNAHWLSFRSTVPAGRAVSISYEDLVDGRVEPLCDLLGLDLRPSLRAYRRRRADPDSDAAGAEATAMWEQLRAHA